MLVLGDSIATGQMGEPEDSWPALLGCSVQAVNGDTTRNCLERIKAAQVLEPEVVIVQFGINDCNVWADSRGLPRVSLKAFAANLEEIKVRMKTFGAKRVIFATNHLTTKRGTERLMEYNSAIRSVADELIDHEKTNPEMVDGVHLSKEGHRLYARTVLLANPFSR